LEKYSPSFPCLSAGGAWYTQRSAVGEDTDSHDDFRHVHRDSVSVPSVYELIEQDIQENPVMVYMKGVPDAPQCGFSSMVCKVLDSYEVRYKSRDVLADQELREGIKSFRYYKT
jgi:monothiol glutaredoxin